jgi:hypothetical protein
MHPERLEKLRTEYTDQLVVVDAARPELARFQGMTGRVKTVNFNGRALVEFDGNNNRGRYDIELDYLKVVEPAEPEPAEPAEELQATVKLSPLELARMAKDSQPKAPPAGKSKSADAG